MHICNHLVKKNTMSIQAFIMYSKAMTNKKGTSFIRKEMACEEGFINHKKTTILSYDLLFIQDNLYDLNTNTYRPMRNVRHIPRKPGDNNIYVNTEGKLVLANCPNYFNWINWNFIAAYQKIQVGVGIVNCVLSNMKLEQKNKKIKNIITTINLLKIFLYVSYCRLWN